MGEATSAVQVQDRKIIGVAAPLHARPRACRPRRGAADVDRGPPAGGVAGGRQGALADPARGPAARAETSAACSRCCRPWHTWYARDDFEAHVQEAVSRSRPGGPPRPSTDRSGHRARMECDRARRAPGVAGAALPRLPRGRSTCPRTRRASVVRIASATARARRPPARELIRSSTRVASNPAPDPFDDDPVREGHLVTESEQLVLKSCAWRVLGPFQGGRRERAGDLDRRGRRRHLRAPRLRAGAERVRLQVERR